MMNRAPDYSDTFTVPIPSRDERSAEELARAGLEGAPAPVRAFILLVHRHVLRFRLHRGTDPGHLLGWTVTEAGDDRFRTEAGGPLYDGVLLATRAPDRLRLDTSLRYRRRVLSRAVWTVVGPVHRLLAPYLLRRAVRERR